MLMMVDPNVHFHVIPRYAEPRSWNEIAFADAGWPGPPRLDRSIELDPEIAPDVGGRGCGQLSITLNAIVIGVSYLRRMLRGRIVLRGEKPHGESPREVAHRNCVPAGDPDLGGPGGTSCRAARQDAAPRCPGRAAPPIPRTRRAARRSHVRPLGYPVEIQVRYLGPTADRRASFPGRRHPAAQRDGAIMAFRRSFAAKSWSARRSDFDPIVEAHPEMQRFFWRLSSAMRRSATNGWSIAAVAIPSRRVAHLLCETAVRMRVDDDDRMVNPFTQQQIADITGQTSVNVNRVLADMERQGLIQPQGPRNRIQRLVRNAPRRELPAGLSGDLIGRSAQREPHPGSARWWARQGLNL